MKSVLLQHGGQSGFTGTGSGSGEAALGLPGGERAQKLA